jgi:hypothetical protein
MTQHVYNQQKNDAILTQIYEGMSVYDPKGSKIGTVNQVRFGAVTSEAEERGLGPATTATVERSERSLLEDFARSISPNEPVPDELRQRLLRRGFIRIDCTGIFTSDRYAMSDQIAHVSGSQVTLKTTRDALLKV